MCYAALTKGTTALMTQLSIAARLGVSEALRAEFGQSQPAMLERMQRAVPEMVPKAHRWVGEMAEIADTFEACGLTPRTFQGAAELAARSPRRPRPRVAEGGAGTAIPSTLSSASSPAAARRITDALAILQSANSGFVALARSFYGLASA